MSEIDQTAASAQDLALFPAWCVQRELGLPWDEAEQARWLRVGQALAASPAVGALPLGLLAQWRAPQAADGDEAEELDQVVRWWDRARREGVPVPADFGELWQAYEATGLQQQLEALGRACRDKHQNGDTAATAHVPALARRAARVAQRYTALKPLLKWLAPLAGIEHGSGFTF